MVALFEIFAICSGKARNLFSSYGEVEQCLWKAFFLLKMQKHGAFLGFFGGGQTWLKMYPPQILSNQEISACKDCPSLTVSSARIMLVQ